MNSINIGIINGNNNTLQTTKTPANTESMQAGLAELFALMLGIKTSENETEGATKRTEEESVLELPDMANPSDEDEEESNLLLAYSLPILHKAPEQQQLLKPIVENVTEQVVEPGQALSKQEIPVAITMLDNSVEEIVIPQEREVAFDNEIEPDFQISTQTKTNIQTKKIQPQEYKSFTENLTIKTDLNNQPKDDFVVKESLAALSELQETKTQKIGTDNKPTHKVEKTEIQKDAQFQQIIKNQTIVLENGIEAVDKKDDIETLPKENIVLVASEVKKALTQGESELILQLKPEGLGKVTINLKKTSEKLEVVLTTERVDTNRLIKDSLVELRNELNANLNDKNSITTIVIEAQEPSLFNTNSNSAGFGAFENQGRSFASDKANPTNYEKDNSIEISDKTVSTTKVSSYKKGKFDLRI